MNYQNKELQQALCNDFVLGIMGKSARKRFCKLLLKDPEWRQRLSETESRWNLLPLKLKDIEPSDRSWTKIEKRIFRDEIKSTTQIEGLDALIRSNRLIKSWAIAASFFAVMLLIPLVKDVSLEKAPPSIVALVQNDVDQGWIIEKGQGLNLQVRAIQTHSLEKQQDYELWLIADNQSKPESLGILPKNGGATIELSAEIADNLKQSAFFAVTIEQKGGSTTGQPTSTPIFTGVLIKS